MTMSGMHLLSLFVIKQSYVFIHTAHAQGLGNPQTIPGLEGCVRYKASYANLQSKTQTNVVLVLLFCALL